MNILFLTISRFVQINNRGIYTDLIRKFRDEGHQVYIVSPHERKYNTETSFSVQEGLHLLGVKTLNIQKTNLIEKGVGTLLLEKQFEKAIQKYLKGVSFDLILYSTPPITFTNAIKAVKKANPQAVSYLLLKDIFPQNAVDLNFFSKKSLFYWYFRKKEVALYKNSDYIGCMSPANVNFVLEHNRFISPEHVEIAPNSIELEQERKLADRLSIRQKYNLTIEKPIFFYGGNLGKPQGIDFLIKCLEANKERKDCHFLIVGNGTEYKKLERWFQAVAPHNASLFTQLPKEDFDQLAQSCDVGLIFLDHRFLIPNYPSRLLSYLEYKKPILAATDIHSDIGSIAEQNGFGYWCESQSVKDFANCIDKYLQNPSSIKEMGERGYHFLLDNYLVEHTYEKIISHLNPKPIIDNSVDTQSAFDSARR